MAENYLKPLTGKVKFRKFATVDIETATDLEKAFLVGFYDGKTYRYFDKQINGESERLYPESREGPVSQFLTWLFSTDDYCKHWIYAHNGGSFDFLYFVRWLSDHGEEFSYTVVPLQSSILQLQVTAKVGVGYGGQSRKKAPRQWNFLDSFRLMPGKLEKLGEVFANQGKIKDINYETLHKDPRRYEYLERDCRLLYQCLESFYVKVQSGGGEIGMTAPSSAMKSFRRMHLSSWIPINRHFPGCKCEKEKS